MQNGFKALAVICTVAGLIGAAPVLADTSKLTPEANQDFLAAYASKPGVVVRPSGLQYRVIKNGPANGKTASTSDTVVVAYSGALIDGEVFDRRKANNPLEIHPNQVIQGWSEALSLMKPGDEWEIVIPANLGYGAQGQGAAVPPNQTLVFDVTLIDVK